ncbi:putative transporter [Colletotrichum aenigma]|uniref:putative transporter n=1 Tax=Colletotrichum aenigma TaxID=1215731 RepID=UPI001872D0F1|nr:putative transporter [Colletotrichum aenigma]KAF5519068.1 putative transporter [Colletotrichum aenigma]
MSVSNMRVVYIAMIVLVAVWGIGQGAFALVACVPLERFWNPSVHAKCVPNAHIAWYISALFNIFTDIIIMILPLPVIRKLNLPGSQKAFLVGIFSVGFFACYSNSRFNIRTQFNMMDQKDNVNTSATASVLSIGMRAVDEKATLPSDSETTRDIRQRILEDQAGSSATQRPATNLSSLWRRQNTSRRPGDIATQPSVFDDPQLAVYFQPSDKYENRHRFDANFRWTWAEEIPLIRKIDWRVTAWSCLAFFALDLDRSNISQANSDNFLEDLGLDTNDYNLGQTVFRVSFLLAELPSQLISKKIGPYADTHTQMPLWCCDVLLTRKPSDRWIPAQMILWSIVSASQFWLNGRSSFLATRAIIGLLQGGFIPDVILYMSYFFKSTELPFRLALFWMANRLTDVIAPLLAYGLLRLRGLFLLEGVLTLVIGIWSVFIMMPSPTQTTAFWRPNGWFTEHEEKIMVNRILRDDPSKSDMHNRQAITLKMLWESLCDYDLWPIYMIGLTFSIPAGPPDQHLTLTLRQLGFDTFDTNLLSILCQVATTINMLFLAWISEKINQRALLGILVELWLLPCVIALAVIPSGVSRWATYALVIVLLSYPSPHPMQVGWASRNSNTVRTRTVSAALYNMSVQLQSIISANIYRRDDRPEYRRGNRALVGVASLNVVIYAAAKFYYVWRNRQRDRIWDAMSPEERQRYLDTTTDKGSKRLDFRFAS